MSNQSTVEYRAIQGFQGYRVGSDGTVWSQRIKGANGKRKLAVGPWKLVSLHRRTYGAKYVMVCLRAVPAGRVTCHYVHRLILEAFIGQCPPGMQCCHNDGNTANNALTNLRWATVLENHADKLRHGTNSRKLTASDVLRIRAMLAAGTPSRTIAKEFSVSQSAIQRISSRTTWKNLTAIVEGDLLPPPNIEAECDPVEPADLATVGAPIPADPDWGI